MRLFLVPALIILLPTIARAECFNSASCLPNGGDSVTPYGGHMNWRCRAVEKKAIDPDTGGPVANGKFYSAGVPCGTVESSEWKKGKLVWTQVVEEDLLGDKPPTDLKCGRPIRADACKV